MKKNNEDVLNRFISSKEIEGCSVKTLNYYKDNISKMFEKINLPICEITTETLRNYLSDYKSNSNSVWFETKKKLWGDVWASREALPWLF